MKKWKKLVSLLAAAAMLTLLPDASTLQARAEEPATFYARFDTDKNQWRIQKGAWDDNSEGREVYYLNNDSDRIKDGDILVVMSNGTGESLGELTVDARLSNLTFQNSAGVVTAKGIDSCYVLGGSVAAVNGNVTNAYVYDKTICTFNNNVNTLHLYSTDETEASVSVGGTVGHLIEEVDGFLVREGYNFAAGKLYYDENGAFSTDVYYFSSSPSVSSPSANSQPVAQPTPTAKPAPAATPTPTAKPAPAGEYDDVPKTGESSLPLWLMISAVLCLTGSFALKKMK